jgi:hypothetical protein
MDIQISWTAGWAGPHDVCYRLQPGPATFTCQTVNCTVGVNTLLITVPTNFCEGALYQGYVLAQCSDPVDSNGDGFPDAASQFTILIPEQADPCLPYQINCDETSVAQISIDVPGSGYLIGETITANGTDVIWQISNVDGLGAILTVVPLPGNNGFTYSVPPTLTINTVGGINADLTAILDTCSLLYGACDGTNNDGNPSPPGSVFRPPLAVGELVVICATSVPDPFVTGVGTVTPLFPGKESCNCQPCAQLIVSNPTGDDISLYYTTCNGANSETATPTPIVLWREVIEAGAANVVIANCVILASVSAGDPGLVIIDNVC